MKITVKAVRKSCGYSVQEMAKMLEISPKIYAFYEKHPAFMPADLAIEFSHIGGVSLDNIFFG